MKHKNTSLAYYEYVMKTLQLLVGMDMEYTLMVIDIRNVDKDAKYDVTYNTNKGEKTIMYYKIFSSNDRPYLHCLYGLSHDINAKITVNSVPALHLHHIDSYYYELLP